LPVALTFAVRVWVKRRIQIPAFAGAGNALHHVDGPGSGKSMVAKRLPTILSPITLAEAIETTKIHSSTCGLLNGSHQFVTERPFRSCTLRSLEDWD
jgi:magnesium chelatase family protein